MCVSMRMVSGPRPWPEATTPQGLGALDQGEREAAMLLLPYLPDVVTARRRECLFSPNRVPPLSIDNLLAGLAARDHDDLERLFAN